MDYIRLMTNLSEHPKWLATSHVGRSVLIGIWLYCGRQETDGHIPAIAAKREGMTTKLAQHLEELGWIHRNGDGWHVHDWTDHQPTVEQLAEKRERGRERIRRWRETHGS